MSAGVTWLLLTTKAHFTPTGLEDAGLCGHVVSHQRQQLWENVPEARCSCQSPPRGLQGPAVMIGSLTRSNECRASKQPWDPRAAVGQMFRVSDFVVGAEAEPGEVLGNQVKPGAVGEGACCRRWAEAPRDRGTWSQEGWSSAGNRSLY